MGVSFAAIQQQAIFTPLFQHLLINKELLYIPADACQSLVG